MSMIHLLGGNPQNPVVLSDNMDWVDATAAANAGWTNTNSPTWGYATSPAPIGGYARNLRVTSSSNRAVCPVFTTGATTWVYCLILPQTLTSDATVMLLTDASDVSIGVAIDFRTTGAIRITSGTTSDSSAGVIVANTMYHMKVGYTAGTGANASISVFVSTTGTWGAAARNKIDGTATANARRVRFAGASSTQEIVAKLRVSTSNFGDNPA